MSRFIYIRTVKLIQVIQGVSLNLALSTAAVMGYPSSCILCMWRNCHAWWNDKRYTLYKWIQSLSLKLTILHCSVIYELPRNASFLYVSVNSTQSDTAASFWKFSLDKTTCDPPYLLTILTGEEEEEEELLNCKWLNINVIKHWALLRQQTWEIWVQLYVSGET